MSGPGIVTEVAVLPLAIWGFGHTRFQPGAVRGDELTIGGLVTGAAGRVLGNQHFLVTAATGVPEMRGAPALRVLRVC